MIRHAANLPLTEPEIDENGLDLDDPFVGLLGEAPSRDDLWLGKPAPRYTSYPPATAFRDDITAEDYRRTLAGLSPEEPLSLYIHVPFCQALCLYCGCHTCPTQRHDRVENYLNGVHRELEHLALTSERAHRISHLHFGGGSPNILSEKDFGLMFGALARRYDLGSCREIALELDPRLVTKAQARILGMMGVTRVSLGVQDFNPDVQKAIGRVQPFDQVKAACDLLRDAGIDQINFDLLYGLPLQSPSSVAETARKALSLRPSRVAFFSYAHVPQAKPHQKLLEQYILPGPHACLTQEKAGRAVWRDAGYVEVGMDHFARPEDALAKAHAERKLRRNFQGYTNDRANYLLGIGASSIGKTPQGYFQNAKDLDEYQELISHKSFATKRGLRLSSDDKFRAAVIEELMCYMSVNLETVCRAHDYSIAGLSEELEALKAYEEGGIISMDGFRITLKSPNRMAIRVIASVFDRSQRAAGAPISRTV